MQIAFDILSWSAWSPEFQTNEAWLNWQAPNINHSLSDLAPSLPQIPTMQRRRYSRLSKMMLHAALNCHASSDCRSVFASRHGELTRTIGLLEDIVAKQPLSPTAFSQSVHNTSSGLYGMAQGNKTSSTSIAAGTQTLPQALIETFAQLECEASPVLFVFGDDPVPPVYNEFINEIELPISLGLQLAVKGGEYQQPPIATLTLNDDLTSCSQDSDICLSQLIHHLASLTPLRGQLCQWHWTLEPHE